MRSNWEALRSKLEPGKFWLSPDRLKAIRLLGCQPVDAATDRTIAQIFVASHALHATGKTAFDDLLSDLKESQLNRLRRNVKAQWPDLYDADQTAMCREILIDLVDEHIERLNEQVQEFVKNADDDAVKCVQASNCDDTTAGHRLRNYVVKCRTGLKGGMANYRKHQEELKQIREMTPTRTPERMRDPSGRARGREQMPEVADRGGRGSQLGIRGRRCRAT